MESPGESGDLGDATPPRTRPLLTLEQEARQAAIEARITSGDTLLYVMYLERVLRRLRQVAPELIAAAEEEVEAGWDD